MAHFLRGDRKMKEVFKRKVKPWDKTCKHTHKNFKCRNCGHIFCGECHNNKIKIEHLEYGLGKMARCCPKCISTDIVPPQEGTH